MRKYPPIKMRSSYERRYGRLAIIGEPEAISVTFNTGLRRSQRVAHCVCDCGNKIDVKLQALKSGNTKSCGCIRVELGAKTFTKHGLSGTNEFKIWQGIIDRCNNPKNESFHNYGGRGIKMYQKWEDSFIDFYNYMGERPSTHHSIDRYPNNDGNYEPGNVRWATNIEQQRNTRQIVIVDYNGEKRKLIELCEEFGIDGQIVRGRIRNGWNVYKSLSTPHSKRKLKK